MSRIKISKKYFFIILLANVTISPLPASNALAMEIQHHKINIEDLRKTQPGKTLTRLNKKIRKKVKSANKHSVDNLDSKIDLLEKAKSIKSSDEYQKAVAILKPISKQTVTCYGAMCGSSSWKQTAIEGMLVNRAASHCFWDKNGNDVCQSTPPREDQLYGGNNKKVPPPDTRLPGSGGGLCVCTDEKGRPYMPVWGHPCGVKDPVWRNYDCQQDQKEVIMRVGPDGNLYVE